MQLTGKQQDAMMAGETSFLLGPAGTGKTAVLQHRLLRLLREGELAYTILVLVAELEQQQAFYDAIHQSDLGAYADLKVTTYNAMAQEMVTLFWPLVARPAGFSRPFQPPTILSYDLAQLLMWHTITPMLEEGGFSDLRLRPQQIVSQLLDTLNRAALNGLSLDEAISRQQTAWAGDPKHIRHLAEAADAARRFRATCLEHSLLDLSLVVEVFDTQLVRHPEFQKYFSERFRHLIIDNVEEQTPAGQNFITHLMDVTETTALAYDAGGGYKRFLAADPTGARL
ncbi:MAG: UvrD-helicase domain-containing protein, partial [Anaerolineales bacterium]|nr:UvrD-helicase domain-containing protein [Anaerolineales bacterium]